MTKTKAQLRAEAVERLRELDAYVDGPESIVDKLVGEIETDRFNYHVEIEYIIDLLTDEEPQNGTTPEFDVPLYGWHEGSVAWILRQYEDEKLMRDVDCDMHVLLETEELEDRIAELQAKVDGLEADNARLRSRMSDDAEYGRLVMGAYRELRAKLDAIREAVDA